MYFSPHHCEAGTSAWWWYISSYWVPHFLYFFVESSKFKYSDYYSTMYILLLTVALHKKQRLVFYIYSATLVLPLLGIRSINRDYYLTASTLFANAHGNQFHLSNFFASRLSYFYNPCFHTPEVSRPTYGSFFRHAQNKMR